MFKWFGRKEDETPAGSAAVASPEEKSPVEADERQGAFAKLRSALSGNSLLGNLLGGVQDERELDDLTIDDIEETLIASDVGLDTAVALADRIRENRQRLTSSARLKDFLHEEFKAILSPFENAHQLKFEPGKCNIYLVVGVNGSGKTTFIGKLAYQFRQQGHRVLIGAGDTFRAAAEDQLAVWAERAGAEIIRADEAASGGADPAAVIFDTLKRARDEGVEVVLLDTAGRLQNKFNLMEEMKKIRRIIDRERPEDSVLEALLVLDATTGQNALKQAKAFQETVDLTGVVLTKLDSSAKGGVVLAVAKEYRLPVKMVGVGEGIEDLQPFETDAFIDGLLDRD